MNDYQYYFIVSIIVVLVLGICFLVGHGFVVLYDVLFNDLTPDIFDFGCMCLTILVLLDIICGVNNTK